MAWSMVCVDRLATRKPELRFGALIRNFVECTVNGTEKNPQTVLSNVSEQCHVDFC